MSAPTQTETPSLADRLVGAFDDDVKREETERTGERSDTSETKEVAEAAAETETSDTADEVTAEAAEETEEIETEETAEAEEGDEIHDDVELAEAIGADPEALREHLKITVGDEKVPLKDLIARATAAPAPEQILEATAQEREHLTGQAQTVQAAFQQQEVTWKALTHALMQEVLGPKYSTEAMAALKEESPDEYLMRSEEKRTRTDQINGYIRRAQELAGNAELMRTPAQQAEDKAAADAVTRTIPGWNDPDTAVAEATIIGRWLQEEMGIPKELIEHPVLRHPGFCHALYMGHQMKRVLEGTTETKDSLKKKKVRGAGRLVPARARRAAENKGAADFARLRKAQRDTATSIEKAGAHAEASRKVLGHFLKE